MSPRLPSRRWVRAVLGLVTAAWLDPATAFAAPHDRFWPTANHDLHRTNHSPTVAKIAAPVVHWQAFLGGGLGDALAVDVDIDGEEDLVLLEGGRAVARRISGELLWATAPIGATALVGVSDLLGSGLPEVITRGPHAAHVLSLQTGAVLWTTPTYVDLMVVSAADFDGDGSHELAVGERGGAGSPTPGVTSIWRLAKGAPHLMGKTPIPSPDIFTSGTAGQRTVDVDGDGAADLLMAGATYVYAFSGKTGALLAGTAKLAAIERDGVGFRSLPAPGGGPPLLVYSADSASTNLELSYRGLIALRLKGTALQVLWQVQAANFVTDRFRTPLSGIGDLDGDGQFEAVSTRFADGAWRLEARDALSGALLHTLKAGDPAWKLAGGPSLTSVFRLGDKGLTVIAAVPAETVEVPAMGPLRLLRWTRVAGFTPFADLGAGALSTANHQRVLNDADAQEPLRAAVPLGLDPAPQVLVLRDLDGDSRADALDVVRVGPTGAALVLASRTFLSAPAPLGLVGSKQGQRLVLALPDGQAQVLDQALALRNDGDADGVADLRHGGNANPLLLVAPIQDKDALPLILTQSAGALIALDPAAAGPLQAPKTLWTFRSGTAVAPRGQMLDVDGDGVREVAVRHRPPLGTATLTVVDAATGKPAWSYVHPNGPWAWSLAWGDTFATFDAQGDGAEDLDLLYEPVGQYVAGMHLQTLIDGKTHQPLWAKDAACNLLSVCAGAVDMAAKPPRLLFSLYVNRHACDTLTGTAVKSPQMTGTYGRPMLADVDGDGKLDQVIGGSHHALSAETTSAFDTLWKLPSQFYAGAAASLYQHAGAWQVATTVGGTPTVEVRDAKTGTLVWTRTYLDGKAFLPTEAPPTPFSAAGLVSADDLTGLGHPSLLFRTTQGWLYAVNATDGSVDWGLDWGGSFGDPVLADVDGDGGVEILVTSSDGNLYALGRGMPGKVAWVRENGGTGPALSDATDVDEQEDASSLHLNWAPLAGVDGYAVRVTDPTGAIIVPQLPVGSSLSTTLTGLHLQPGLSYRAAVFGYVDKGKDKAWTEASLSDGVTVVDASAPWLEDVRFDPPVVAPGGSSVLRGRLRDKTRVTGWTARLHAVGAEATALLQHDAPAGLATVEVALPYAATGLTGATVVQAVVKATDSAGHAAQATAALQVCATGETVTAAGCEPAALHPDAGGTAGPVGLNGKRVDEGCQAGRAADGVAWWLACAGLLLAWAAFRRWRLR